ncbi:MAG: LamG domain-containing protein [Planctomycetes bacterium]|nr:LamG domain-containing protein [Planctomycetota bacterium]MCH8119237.1 LamG domain-containing protein [Planctomycetota bacterium]
MAGPFKFDSKPYTITIPSTISTALHTLIARWKLDETEGSSANDSSGNNLVGTLVGNPQWQPSGGKFGGALKLDGVDDYVETNYATDLPVWTLAVWVNSPAVPSSEVPSGPVHRNKNYHINWNHSFDDFRGTAGVQVGGTWHAASFGDLQANTWYHLAATYDGEDFKAYKDGILITNNSTPSGDPDSESTTLKLGRHSLYGDHFVGTIDDVRIYNYALSQADIAKIFADKKLGKGVSWTPVLVIVVIAAVAAGLAIYRKKATA